MRTFNQNECAFLIVDIQEKLVNAVFNKDIILKKAEILAKASNILEIPVIITEQYPKGLGETVQTVKKSLSDAVYFEKTNFNALQDEELVKHLAQLDKKQIFVVGIETHICVYQTVAALIDAGFEVVVIRDCCGSRDKEEYLSALEYMKSLGVNVKTTEMLLFELLKGAKHPKFKEIQSLIK